MKKLLTILVICVLAVSLYAVDNPFTFSLSAKLQGKFSDTSKPGYQSQASTSYDDDGSLVKPVLTTDADNNWVTANTSLKVELDAGMSTTIAEIYTLSFGITEKPEISANAANEVNFKIMGNSIKVLPDYLTLGFDLKWNLFHGEVTSVTGATAAMDMDGNGTNETYVTGVSADSNSQVTGRFDMVLSLSGSVPDSGFSWGLTSDNRLNFNLYAATDNDPVYSGFGTAASRDGNTAGFFNSYYTENKLELKMEVGHFFMPENMSMTIIIDPVLKVTVPYSYYIEQLKTIETETNPGIKLGLAGFDVGLFCYIATSDTAGSSAPAGSAGSAYTWNKKATVGTDHAAVASYTYDNATDNQGNNSYPFRDPSGVLKVGPKLTLGFTQGMGSFGFMWKGYASNLRDVNWSKDNKYNSTWTNEFEIDVKIAF